MCCLLLLSEKLVGQTADKNGIEYFTERTVNKKPVAKKLILIGSDSLNKATDTIFQCVDEHDLPVFYYKNLNQEICFDGTCRRLNVDIYWNVTGRYLGFKLPSKEFLSKSEHKPFLESEYLRLHELLKDSLSIFSSIDINEIITSKPVLSKVDAVTRPTSEDVLQYVVEGAVFTTFAMWKGIYGQAHKMVEKETEKKLNDRFMLEVLQSPVGWDRIWGLKRLFLVKNPSKDLVQRTITIAGLDEYSVSRNAISFIPIDWLTDYQVQRSLWSIFSNIEYSLRPNLIQKLAQSQEVDKFILLEIANDLSQQSGPLLVSSLNCLKKYIHVHPDIYKKVKELSKSENSYIVKQVEKILSEP